MRSLRNSCLLTTDRWRQSTYGCKYSRVPHSTAATAPTTHPTASDEVVAASVWNARYMDTMHASVKQTNYFLKACCMHPPAGVKQAFLTPQAVLASTKAFEDARSALEHQMIEQQQQQQQQQQHVAVAVPNATVAKYLERVERAMMGTTYVILWRWDELRSFAANTSLPWPLRQTTKAAAFDSFEFVYNRTGTQFLVSGHAGNPRGGSLHHMLGWFKVCVMTPSKCCVPGNGCKLPP
jgi:hypothetical protein